MTAPPDLDELIARLRAARESLKAHDVTIPEWDGSLYLAAADALESMRAALAHTSQDAADAARYRWVKRQVRTFSLDMGGQHTYAMMGSFMRARGPSLDAAIDAARLQDTKEE